MNGCLISITLALSLCLKAQAGDLMLQPLPRSATPNPPVGGVHIHIPMGDIIEQYPGARSTLAYVKVDTTETTRLISEFEERLQIQNHYGTRLVPQLAIELKNTDLKQWIENMGNPHSLTYQNVHALAKAIAAQKSTGLRVFLRPFSEMNNGSPKNRWGLYHALNRDSGGPARFAHAWALIHAAFDQEGATNALFIFAPLIARGMERTDRTMQALNKIPLGMVDSLGMNVYSRPHFGRNADSFESLARPWMNVLTRSRHKKLPWSVPEMGVSSELTDAGRARWIHRAFQFCRSHSFVLVTYFDWKVDTGDQHRSYHWHLNDSPEARTALDSELKAMNPEVAYF